MLTGYVAIFFDFLSIFYMLRNSFPCPPSRFDLWTICLTTTRGQRSLWLLQRFSCFSFCSLNSAMMSLYCEFSVTGEVLRLIHVARGVDSEGVLLLDIVVNGYVPPSLTSSSSSSHVSLQVSSHLRPSLYID